MKFCQADNCDNPVFGKGFCRNHQYKRADFDKRSIVQRGIDRHREEKKNKPTKKGWFDLQSAFEDNEPKSALPTAFIPSREQEVNEIDKLEVKNGIDESLINLSADLDMVMSLYIRHKNSDKNGMVKCFTCPKILSIKEIQNGHYCKRGNRATRFLERNMRPQCPECNQDHNYDETPYTNALEAETPGVTAELKELAKTTHKATRNELKSLLVEYRSKLEILKRRYE